MAREISIVEKSKRPVPSAEKGAIAKGPHTLYLIKQVQYAAYVRLERVLSPLGVTAVQFRILSTINYQDRLSSAELGRMYNVKPQTMIKQIVILEAKGLIKRRVGAANKRVLEVELTPKGREVLKACDTEGTALETDVLKAFSPGEQQLYREFLLKVLDKLDAMDEASPTEPVEHQWESPEGERPGVQRPMKAAAKRAKKVVAKA